MIGQLVAAVRRPAFMLGRKQRETAIHEAPLPWHVGDFLERESCMIFDATGRHIATVDEWANMPDEEALAIATRIVNAVNARAARGQP